MIWIGLGLIVLVLAAVAIHGIAGDIAAETAGGPGSFQSALLDALFNLSAEDIETRLKL